MTSKHEEEKMETLKNSPTLSRRGFLMTSGAVAGAAVASGGLSLVQLAAADESDKVEEQVFNCVHRPECESACPVKVTVREGKVVKVSRGEAVDPYYNRICLRGMSHVQNIYNENRLKYPMRRTGERGSGEFERISWDEAIDEVTTKFKEIQETYGPQAVLTMFSGANQSASVLDGFLKFSFALNGTGYTYAVDRGFPEGFKRVVGTDTLWLNEPKDWVNAKTFISWGANITEANINEWPSVARAKENGTKIIVVDPNFTWIASKADWWLPIRPGSDAALYLGMLNVIVNESLEDEKFVMAHTCAPFLVRNDTGMFLRRSDVTGVPEEKTDMMGNVINVSPVLVWDSATSKALTLEECKAPSKKGTHSVNGIKCTTAYSLLEDLVSTYTPEKVSELTDLSAEDITALARLCAEGSVIHRMGFGSSDYQNGRQVGHGLMTLCALTGNIGKPGCGAGHGSNGGMASGDFMGAIMVAGTYGMGSYPTFHLREVVKTGKNMGNDWPIKAIYTCIINPISSEVDSTAVEEMFKAMDFVVVQDVVYTDTAAFADIVLPACDFFESSDWIQGSSHDNLIQWSEKAIEPLYESKPDYEIFSLLAQKMGFGEIFSDGADKFVEAFTSTDEFKAIGADSPTLKEKGRVHYYSDDINIPWSDYQFPTGSGRMEFYCENPQPRAFFGQELDPTDEHLPVWHEPVEAWPGAEARDKYPLILMAERTRNMVHIAFHGNPWLHEIQDEPIVKIGAADAQARGIQDGSYVEVFNDRGAVVARAVLNEGNHPGVLRYYPGWQKHQHKTNAGWNTLLASHYDPYVVNQNIMDVVVDVRPWTEGE